MGVLVCRYGLCGRNSVFDFYFMLVVEICLYVYIFNNFYFLFIIVFDDSVWFFNVLFIVYFYVRGLVLVIIVNVLV